MERPRRFKVLLHNDDFTPMEFVIMVLMELFHRSSAEATRIMLHVHRNGVGVAGVFSREIAEAKAARRAQDVKPEKPPAPGPEDVAFWKRYFDL